MDYCQVDLYRDIYTYNSDTAAPVQTRPAGEGYTELLTWLDDYLAEYTVSDPEKNEIDVGEKRIGAPTIIKVANLERVNVKVEISEADIVKVKPGQRVTFTILGEPGKRFDETLFRAAVEKSRVGLAEIPVKVFRVPAIARGPSGRVLRAGMVQHLLHRS